MARRRRLGRLLGLVGSLLVGGAAGYLIRGGAPGPVPAPGGDIGSTVLQDEATMALDFRSIANGTAGPSADALWLQASTLADTLSHAGLDRYVWRGNHSVTPPALAAGLTALDTADLELALATQGPAPSGPTGRAWAAHVAYVLQAELLPAERAAAASTLLPAGIQRFDQQMAALAAWVGQHQP